MVQEFAWKQKVSLWDNRLKWHFKLCFRKNQLKIKSLKVIVTVLSASLYTAVIKAQHHPTSWHSLMTYSLHSIMGTQSCVITNVKCISHVFQSCLKMYSMVMCLIFPECEIIVASSLTSAPKGIAVVFHHNELFSFNSEACLKSTADLYHTPTQGHRQATFYAFVVKKGNHSGMSTDKTFYSLLAFTETRDNTTFRQVFSAQKTGLVISTCNNKVHHTVTKWTSPVELQCNLFKPILQLGLAL